MLLNSIGSMLFCGDSNGCVTIYNAWNLQETSQRIQFQDHGAVTSMVFQAGKIILSYYYYYYYSH